MDNVSNSNAGESNPIGQQLNVNVSVPKKIQIELVDASTLSDLEIWIFIASLLSNFVVGFVVAAIQTTSDSSIQNIYILVAILFFVLLIISGIMVYVKYIKMSNEKNSFDMEVKSIQQS